MSMSFADSQNRLEDQKTHLEKIMMQQPKDATDNERRHYLAGYLDSWEENGTITEEEREILYQEYCF